MANKDVKDGDVRHHVHGLMKWNAWLARTVMGKGRVCLIILVQIILCNTRGSTWVGRWIVEALIK